MRCCVDRSVMIGSRVVVLVVMMVSTVLSLSDVDLMTLKLNLHVLDRVPASVVVSFLEPAPERSLEREVTSEINYTSLENMNIEKSASRRKHTELEGFFLLDGRIEKFAGALIVVDQFVNEQRQAENSCDPEWPSSMNISRSRWIALVVLGKCSLKVKIDNMVKNNASAVVVYSQQQVVFNTMKVGRVEVPVLLLHETTERWLVSRWSLNWTISVSPDVSAISEAIRAYTSRVAMATGWLTLLMLCLLVCCSIAQVQRFRHTHSNNRAMKALIGCSGHAVTRLPTLTLSGGDFRITDGHTCVICLESYTPAQVVRILPCQHVFHQCCVDQWLLLRHTCPICKLNILQYFGMEVDTLDADRSTTAVEPSRNVVDSPDVLLVVRTSREQMEDPLEGGSEMCAVGTGDNLSQPQGQSVNPASVQQPGHYALLANTSGPSLQGS